LPVYFTFLGINLALTSPVLTSKTEDWDEVRIHELVACFTDVLIRRYQLHFGTGGAGMARQGRALTEDEVAKIINLLYATEMTIPEIAQRMSCSRSAVASVNRKFQVRDYAGLRSTWSLQKIS
jgi:hypothetical protein